MLMELDLESFLSLYFICISKALESRKFVLSDSHLIFTIAPANRLIQKFPVGWELDGPKSILRPSLCCFFFEVFSRPHEWLSLMYFNNLLFLPSQWHFSHCFLIISFLVCLPL